MSGTSEALRVSELATARRYQTISGLAAVPSGPDADRLRLLQAAWGPDQEPLSRQQLQELAAGLPDGVAIDASAVADDCVFPPRVGRIVLNLLLLAAEGLPGGGTIMLAGSADDLFLQIDGPNASWPAGTGACVVNQADALAAMSTDDGAQMPLTALLAHASGVRLSILLAPSRQTQVPILRLGG